MDIRTVTALALLMAATCLANRSDHRKQKRQIFREQVLPHSGGKIPEDAFRSDRLALNRLNKEGIAIPDGVLLESRHKESHFKSYRDDPEIADSIIKLVQRPDGRYAPPEGRYPFNNLVESTYVIRKPINSHGPVLPPQVPVTTPLRLPARSIFHSEEEYPFSVNHLDGLIDILGAQTPDFTGTRVWTGFGHLYTDVPNRILRQAGALPSASTASSTIIGPHFGRYPSLTYIPKTSFTCSRTVNERMQADHFTGCQVFHLCENGADRESFLCPIGLRFDGQKSQCLPWKKVPCPLKR